MPCLSWPRLASPCLSLPCLASPVLYRVSWVSFGQTLTEKGGRRFASGPFAPVGRPPTHEFPHRAVVAASKVVGFATRLRAPKSCVGGGPMIRKKEVQTDRPTLPCLAWPCLAWPCLASPLCRASWVSFSPPPAKGAPDQHQKGRRTILCGEVRTGRFLPKWAFSFFFRPFP